MPKQLIYSQLLNGYFKGNGSLTVGGKNISKKFHGTKTDKYAKKKAWENTHVKDRIKAQEN